MATAGIALAVSIIFSSAPRCESSINFFRPEVVLARGRLVRVWPSPPPATMALWRPPAAQYVYRKGCSRRHTLHPARIENPIRQAHSRSLAGPKSQNGKLLNMQGGFLIRHSRLTALGIVLCVLAALFAVEAKIAWFSPAGSATAQISYDKAQPVEPARLLPAVLQASSDPAEMTVPVVSALLLPIAILGVAFLVSVNARLSPAPPFFALFFRPPPAR